jgi:hypothetical protein
MSDFFQIHQIYSLFHLGLLQFLRLQLSPHLHWQKPSYLLTPIFTVPTGDRSRFPGFRGINPCKENKKRTCWGLVQLPRIPMNQSLQKMKQTVQYLLETRVPQGPGESILARRRNKLYQLGLQQLLRIQVNPSLQGEETSCTSWGLKQLPSLGRSVIGNRRNNLYLMETNPPLQTEEQTVPAWA